MPHIEIRCIYVNILKYNYKVIYCRGKVDCFSVAISQKPCKPWDPNLSSYILEAESN